LPCYRVYAIKYAQRSGRRAEHFLGGDPHDQPMDMDYFVWAVVSDGAVWVVDTGFEASDAQSRRRTLVRSVSEALAAVGVTAAEVDNVIITHLHYDHIGGFAQFPRATFHVQDREVAFATGRYMTHPLLNHGFTIDHITGLIALVYRQRVAFHDGDEELAPGLSVHHVGGHTQGLQVVRIHTETGWLVLASDASHYYEHLDRGRAFTTVYHVGEMLEGHRRCRALADEPWMIIPGHDPQVLERHPPAGPGLEGIAARVDLRPTPASARSE
jgi:glyoxylase-like metal-dependent hydrolase (beta-lactamase superfamily II)